MEASRSRHPDPLQLQSYVDGELAANEALALEVHLRGCAGCRREVDGLRGLAVELSAVPDVPVGRDLSAQILSAVSGRRTRLLLWVATLELTAGLAVLVFAWPLAARPASALRGLVVGFGLSAIRACLSDWAVQAQGLLTSLGRAFEFDVPRIVPAWGVAQIGALIGLMAVGWAIGNFVLLRRRSPEGEAR